MTKAREMALASARGVSLLSWVVEHSACDCCGFRARNLDAGPRERDDAAMESLLARAWDDAWDIIAPILNAEVLNQRREYNERVTDADQAGLLAAIGRARDAISIGFSPDLGGLMAIGGELFGHALNEARQVVLRATSNDVRAASRALTVNAYGAANEADALARWALDNAQLVRSLPDLVLDDLAKLVQSSVEAGTRPDTLAKLIAERFDIGQRHARLIARDQTGKLHARTTMEAYQRTGSIGYRWRTSKDNKVRPEHKAREGDFFRWGEDPPDGPPGIPVLCRCGADPVWDDDDLALAA